MCISCNIHIQVYSGALEYMLQEAFHSKQMLPVLPW